MPNRIIKESIRTSDSINSLSWFEEVLFYRLIVSCDDFGRYDGRVAIIKGNCFPLKSGINNKTIEDALNKLVTVGIVCRYYANGKPYLQLPSWEQHQQIRAKKSKYPAPEYVHGKLESLCNVNVSDCNCNNLISDDINSNQVQSNVTVIQSNPNPNTNPINTLCTADADALFERLWSLYPSKRGKAHVSVSKKKKLLEVGEKKMRTAIERYVRELDKDKDWRKPQNGSTFFNGGYVDYLDGNYVPDNNRSKSAFGAMEEQNYDIDAIEKELSL